jgi:hypothetical protein
MSPLSLNPPQKTKYDMRGVNDVHRSNTEEHGYLLSQSAREL